MDTAAENSITGLAAPTMGGRVSPGFEPVKQVFEALWEDIEVGASFCAYHRGTKVVDLWGGFMDTEMQQPWRQDTLVNVYSCTKGMSALALAILHDEGQLDYQQTVCHYWPEFGAAGKQAITVAQLLSHQAGLFGVDASLTITDFYDWPKMTNLLAAQAPLCTPADGSGYHGITWGFLAGELVRRITGKTLGQYFHEKVAEPLDADFFIGLPDAHTRRCATLIGSNRARRQPPPGPAKTPAPFFAIAQQNPILRPFKDVCSPAWRRAEIPSANGHSNARAMARIYAAVAAGGTLDGVRIISPQALKTASRVVFEEPMDLVLNKSMRWGMGFMLNNRKEFGPNDNAFGHDGTNGFIAFADPDQELAIGYAMNQLRSHPTAPPRATLLINAVNACISA